MNQKRTAIYCRVDRGGNPEQWHHVLTLQREKLERYAVSHGLQIVGYYQDAGYSGHDLSRPELNRMLNDWNAGKFDIVLIAKHTRLFRGNIWNEPKWPFPIISANQMDHIHDCAKRR